MQELGELMIYRSQINKLADGEWDDGPEFSLGPLKRSLMYVCRKCETDAR